MIMMSYNDREGYDNGNGHLQQKCPQQYLPQYHYPSNEKRTPSAEHEDCTEKISYTEQHHNESENDELQLQQQQQYGKTNIALKCSNAYNLVVGRPAGNKPTNLYQIICFVTLAVLCYYNSTQCGLVFDDISAIRDNRDLRPFTPFKQIFLNDFWGTPMRKEQSHKSYRPLTVLTFRLNYWLHDLQPYGYHAINVILHIAVCLLWRRVSRLLMRQCTLSEYLADECSFLSTLLFIVHPIHTEAVTGVVGRAELLSSLFYLGAFLCYANSVQGGGASNLMMAQRLRSRTASSSTVTGFRTRWMKLIIGFTSCLLASMLCKEQGITIAGICMAYEVIVVQNIHPIQLWYSIVNVFESNDYSSNSNNNQLSSPIKKGCQQRTSSSSSRYTTTTTISIWTSTLVKRLCFLCGVVILLLVGRVYVMGSQLPIFTRFDNPASVAPAPQRQLTYGYLIYLNIWLLLFPCDLCCDWTMGKFIIDE